MKKIGIVTIYDTDNYGNRLQNYALFKFLSKKGYDVETIKNTDVLNKKDNYLIKTIMKSIYYIVHKKNRSTNINSKREYSFSQFDKNIKLTKYTFSNLKKRYLKKYDFVVAGSDQIWNPTFGRLKTFDLMDYKEIKNKIAYAASFGISDLPDSCNQDYLSKCFNDIKYLSVREEQGKKILEKLTGRKDIEVVLDPTMLLSAKEWEKVIKKPSQLKNDGKYILCYFLGNFSNTRRLEIERVAKENDCQIIDILDYNDPFYICGPSEFLYLEKHAFLICTDSFHSSVFAVLFDRPFVVFGREEKNVKNMNSRIETFISKLGLVNRQFNGKSITDENINHDYSEAYEILEEERKKAQLFLDRALGECCNEN